MTEYELRAWVCAVAKAWLGRKEADGSHREIIDVYNAGRVPGSYAMTYTDPWCAAFVSAVGMKAGCGDIIIPNVACDPMIGAYEACGGWREEDNYDAWPGDLIFYDWQDDGVGDDRGSADHVGIVVDNDGRTLTVIEGNCSDMVKYRTVLINGKNIRGFAVPDYRRKAAGMSGGSGTTVPGTENGGKTGTGPADGAEKEKGETGGPDAGKADGAGKAEPRLCDELPELCFGCCGRQVVVMQGILIALGYSCGLDGADGDFGYNTQVAVRNFQRGAGIAEDGICGRQTWAKLLGVSA